jgi:hypothetical protein
MFIGDPTRSQLSEKYTKKFEADFLEYAFFSKGKKMLFQSIKLACKMYNQENPGLLERL